MAYETNYLIILEKRYGRKTLPPMKPPTKKAANAAFNAVRNEGCLNRSWRSAFVVFLTEFFNTACCVHNFLCSGIKRMALGANLDMQRLGQSRTGSEFVTAAASYCNFVICWMSVGFHLFSFVNNRCGKGVRTHEGADYP